MEYYLAIKKNEIMPFAATWMDLGIILLSEVSQKKDKYDPERCCGEGGGRGVHVWERM